MEENYSKKIRILSFQNAHNFGAILQAYGLQQTIRSMGYKDVKFINYNPKYLSDRYNPYAWANIKPVQLSLRSIIGKIIRYPAYFISAIRRNRAFNSSIDRLLKQTARRVTKEADLINEEYDVLVCGSDQIWNTALTGTFDPVFMAQGPYKKRGFAISYAPSTELSALTDEKARELSLLIKSFRHISVRENPIKEKLQGYVTKDIKVCVDPTILCGAEAYNQIVASKQKDEPYILVYAYNPYDKFILDVVRTIPDWEKYNVYSILLGARTVRNLFDRRILCELSIEQFLSYIKNASYVVTNSFHGLAFSLLFKKNFNVVYEPGKHVRCESLLERIDLLDRFVKDLRTVSWRELNYREIDEKIASIRKESYEYLKESLIN